MKRFGFWILAIFFLVGTAVACAQPTLQNNQIVGLPPTATFIPQSQEANETTTASTPVTISIPTETATATITPTLTTTSVTTYTIQPGDTLANIGNRFDVEVEEIVEANNLANPNNITAGETILIPQEVTAVPPTNTPVPTATTTPAQATAEAEDGGGTPIPPEELAATGRLELTHPLTMVVDQSGVITVEIIADPDLAEIGDHDPHVTGVVRIDASYDDGERAFYEQTVELFPLMSAELNAPAFDVFPSGGNNVRLPRVISTTLPAVWTWDIIATTPGEAQVITLNLYKEPDSETGVPILTQSISRNIEVVTKSLWSRIVTGLADNVLLLLGTGGPLGLLLAYLTYRTSKENERLKKQVTNGESNDHE